MPARIELLTPAEGDNVWRIRLEEKNREPMELATEIGIAAETKAVILSLLKSWPRAQIKTAAGEVLNPRPPGELPRLSRHQI
jgi:hypothetical protein